MNEQGIVMSDKSVTLNEQRWKELVNKVKYELNSAKDCGDDTTEDEISLIVSVLKNNIPFDVVGEN